MLNPTDDITWAEKLNLKTIIAGSLLILLNSAVAHAQDEVVIPMTADAWSSKTNEVAFITHKNVQAMQILSSNELMVLDDLEFTDGTIEFDVEMTGAGFSIYFRRESDEEAEIVYFRGFRLSNPSAPDVIQYSAVTNGVLLWDLHGHYQGPADHAQGEWNHVKMVVSGNQMLFYINDMQWPVLQIPHLEANSKVGGIALEGASIFANLKVRHDDVEGLSPVSGIDITEHDARYIRKWEVSEPFALPPGNELASPQRVGVAGPYLPDENTTWSHIEAERLGLVNLSRRFGNNTERHAVWLKTTVQSSRRQNRYLDLGYSDEVWVLVNGALAYADKNIYFHPSMKEPEGRIGVENSRVNLPLGPGENEILIGVANDFWGWGIIGRLDDVTEVRLDGRETMAYTHNDPPDLKDGWQVDKLASVGLNDDKVKHVITNIAFTDENNDFRSLLVAKNNKLVVEQYFNSYRPETIHDVRSAGKSVTGTLVGIAVDKGVLSGVDQEAISFFNDYPGYSNKGNGKEEITLAHLLNMSAGFDADADDGRTPGNEGNLVASDNFVQFVLDLPMRFTPGERYQYNSASAYLAGAMVEKASGETLSDFANEHLFGPLGIKQYFWTKGPMNTTFGMGGLFLTARDFAKIGQLYVNKGEWNGRRVLSSAWVEQSLESTFELNIAGLQTGYSNLWLSGKRQVMGRDFDVYYASGNGGNIVAIVPELELVVAIQQSAYGQGFAPYRAFQAIDGMIAAALME